MICLMFNVPYIPSAEKLLDIAFRAGSREAKKARSTRKSREIRMMVSEERRIHIISKRICGDLTSIVKTFPSYERLPLFYQRLFDIEVDKDRYKKSLGALSWVSDKIKTLEYETIQSIRSEKPNASKHFLGKTSSLVKRVSSDLPYLYAVSRTLKAFPTVKELPTLVVAGYPNVGKSTFVRNLTKSKIKVAAYPFTTQGLSIGYVKIRHQSIQVIDSPGLLDRPMADRNKIEQRAILALSELADKIFFIFDPTYDFAPQIKLLDDVSENFDTQLFVGVNKVDAVSGDVLSAAEKACAGCSVLRFSALDEADCRRVFTEMFA